MVPPFPFFPLFFITLKMRVRITDNQKLPMKYIMENIFTQICLTCLGSKIHEKRASRRTITVFPLIEPPEALFFKGPTEGNFKKIQKKS